MVLQSLMIVQIEIYKTLLIVHRELLFSNHYKSIGGDFGQCPKSPHKECIEKIKGIVTNSFKDYKCLHS